MKIPYRTKTKIIDLANLTPDDICIEDIACALAGQNRFNGITRPVYTVAQHSVLCAMQAPAGYELAALLHDAHEYILGDISRPVAKLLAKVEHEEKGCWLSCIDITKDKIDHKIETKFNLMPYYLEHDIVSEIDNRMLATEMVRFFGTNYLTDVQPYDQSVIGKIWSTDMAERIFMYKFEQLTGAK
jgi:hypothetical protein